MNLKRFISKYSPEILMGFGITGMVTTTIMAIFETPKALELIECKKENEKKDELSKKEIIKTTWRCYVPSAALGGVSIACLLLANDISNRQRAALATAYSISEAAFRDYHDKVVQTVGKRKEKAIQDDIDKDKMDRNPVSERDVIITGRGQTLCYDPISDRYFESDIEKLKWIENKLNKEMISEMCISLNDLYAEIGLKSIDMGYEIGWNINRALIEFSFSSQIASDGRPCLVINYVNPPEYRYQDY